MPENERMTLERRVATRYVLPLREGGSLPAIVDTDGREQYVLKFRGAGQGVKALVAEAIAGGLAQALGLPLPGMAVVKLAEGFGSGEPDPEIQDLLRASVGKNFGLEYLSGALGFDPVADAKRLDAGLASSIVWFDALITNVDRTPRNPNLLVWRDQLWLIDHGASLYFHHADGDWSRRAGDRFPLVKQHILLHWATELAAVDASMTEKLGEQAIQAVVGSLPDDWLGEEPEAARRGYVDYLTRRLADRASWLEEAERAQRSA